MDVQPQYLLVGSNWSGDDQAEAFYRRVYWEIGYRDQEQPLFAERRDSMRPGDRVAVKSMRGRGASTITVKGLGIVREVAEDGRVYIDWLVTGLDREVVSKGCFKTIHGPYDMDQESEWLRTVFCI